MRLATQKELEERKLNEIRDEMAEKSVNRNIMELNEADGRVRHFKQGFDAAVKLKDEEWEKRVAVLVEALVLANDELLTIDDHINYRKMERYYTDERSKNINLIIHKINKAIENFRKEVGE